MEDRSVKTSRVVRLEKEQGRGVQQIRQMAELNPFTVAELEERKILHPGMLNKEILNTFREIRTKLVKLSAKENFVLLLSSVCAGGGSSFMCVNLAASFALDQSKTALLVDCNHYDPSVEKMFNIQPEYGLTDYLEDSTLGIDDIIYATGVRRLRVIPVGSYREAGAEYFSSERMGQFINDLKERYPDRYIFLDVPPVGVSAEGRILAELCDFALLVVPYGKVTEAQIQASVDAVSSEKLAGAVFNN